jgi:hypothetical protein
MAQFDKIAQSAAESLYEDERLRSNMTDGEAKVVLDWALGWISSQVNAGRDEASAKQIAQSELARVRQTVNAINALAKQPGPLRLSDAIAALDASLPSNRAFSREEIFSLLTVLTSATWQMRAGMAQP